jgi:hypothetical protein
MSPALVKRKGDSASLSAAKESRSSGLRIGSPSDDLEREADQVADAITSNANPPGWSLRNVSFGQIQRKCSCQESGASECEECRKKKETLQRKPAGPAQSNTAPAIVDRVLQSPGRPLDNATRGFFEPRFGHDFSRVRVHTDSQAAVSSRAVNAHAYTVNDHIVFAGGRFDPVGSAGRHLLAHELAHVTQQQGGRSSLLRREPDQHGPLEVGLSEPDECEGRADITQEFKDFVKGLPAMLASAPDFTPEQRDSFKAEFDRFLRTEAGVNVKTFKVISCDKINSDLMVAGETAQAEVDPSKKEIRLSKSTKQLMDDFKQTKDKALLGKLIETLAHEKRHVTLGAALKVDPKNVLPGRPDTVAQKAEYRAQEILAVAEEIAVGRMAFGKSFAVSESKQEKLRRQNNMIKNYVNEGEYKRLRSIIIAKLRERYGFEHGCDNALTLGVVSSMDHNRWFECVPGSATGIVPPVPADLHICDGFCQTQVPRPANTENEEDVKIQRKAADSGASIPAFAPASVDSALQSSGCPLDAATRAYFEPRFGYDFSRVRVYTDAQAAESARGVNALAYTVGDRIAFGEGRYAPHTSDGRRLLAHELAHTVQQVQGTAVSDLVRRMTADEAKELQDEEFEREWRKNHPRPRPKPARPGEVAQVDEEAEHADREAFKAWSEERRRQLASQVRYFDDTSKPKAGGAKDKPTDAEKNVKAAWRASTTPQQKAEAAQMPAPRLFIGQHEKALLEASTMFDAVPGGKLGRLSAEFLEGKDILNRKLNRRELAKDIGKEAVMQVVPLLLPEEGLLEAGGGEGAAFEGELESNATPLAEHPEGFWDRAIELPEAPEAMPIEPTATPAAEPHAGFSEGAIELPEAPKEIPVEPTASPSIGEVKTRKPNGFEPTLKGTGRPVKAGTMKSLQPNATPKAVRATDATKPIKLPNAGKLAKSRTGREHIAGIREQRIETEVREASPPTELRGGRITRSDLTRVQAGMPDPAFPHDPQLVDAVQTDHIYPLSRMYEIEGAEYLNQAELEELANFKENFTSMSRRVNTSRGDLHFSEWAESDLGRQADRDWLDHMIAAEDDAGRKIQQRIAEMLKKKFKKGLPIGK